MQPNYPNSQPPRSKRAVMAAGVRLEFGEATDSGLDPAKQVNEDSMGYAQSKFGHLFVICDGMGGHVGGKQASELAVKSIFEVFESQPDHMRPIDALQHAIEEAARRVFDFGGPPNNPARPGSTCVALLLHNGRIETAHVGDSRAYAIRANQIYRLTRDHSMVQSLLDQGLLSEQEAIGHPDSNKITRALGMTPQVEVEVQPEPMELFEGDVFVLATDGLTDLARNDDILITVREYLKTHDVQTAAVELVALANRRGGHDNITVQVVRIVGTGPKSARTLPEQPSGLAKLADRQSGPPLSKTIDGSPLSRESGRGSDTAKGMGPPRTLVQEPFFDDGSGPLSGGLPQTHAQPLGGAPSGAASGVATTQPDKISPTIIDATLRDSHPRLMPPARALDKQRSRFVYVILVMAAVIGVLMMLLIWALYYKS